MNFLAVCAIYILFIRECIMFAHVCIICCIGLYYIVVSGRFLKLKCETILKTLRLAVIHESLFVV